ncbi:hypothetical protein BAUCODRAFT_126159 [Baudoinia panamericana UAMH 10762]|uniref:MARVEL domain-containing protein n=1 Tax=Baudoinia panamericana (strain UAMH 10762) TaxID=717646 RepID=M2LDU5_BAUPA|nr:uncharacterized protein BAUCODRAFT_126159 [Baudoinia panamericana UAMH 10762]EMC92152.1 hypothetical protein BAUCODRAFT_126159 [Baudoinia panamericana UAMH 10762]
MRRIIYGISLWVFVAAAACTIAAIALPEWITYTAPTSSPSSTPIKIAYGLHKRCSSLTGQCTKFPQYEDCQDGDRYFCSMWRSTGFFMNLSVVMELACVIAYITILVGGRASREAGWKILAVLLGLVAAGQLIAMALVAYLYDHDKRFFPGWVLDKAWILCTVSWSVLVVDMFGILLAKLLMPREDDYEPIPEPRL